MFLNKKKIFFYSFLFLAGFFLGSPILHAENDYSVETTPSLQEPVKKKLHINIVADESNIIDPAPATTAGSCSSGSTICFDNLVGETEATSFLQKIMGKLQGIIGFIAVLFMVLAGVLYTLAGVNQKMADTAKEMFTAAIIGLVLVLAAPTFLKEIKGVLFTGGQVPTDLNQIMTLTQIVQRTLTFLLSLVGSLGVLGIVLSGTFYLTAIADPNQAKSASLALKYSILGILTAGVSIILVKEIARLITG